MSKLLIHDRPVMILPKLAEAVGLKEAVVLQQLHYWLVTVRQGGDEEKHFHDGRWWVYNSKSDWGEQFPWWHENTVWRALKQLRELGLVRATSDYNEEGFDQTLWYTIDYGKVQEVERAIYPQSVNGHTHSEDDNTIDYTETTKETRPTNTEDSDTLPGGSTKTKGTASIEVKDASPAGEALPRKETPGGKNSDDGLTLAQRNFSMLARVCAIDLETMTEDQRGQLNQTEGILRKKKGVTPEDIEEFGLWWWKHFWRGQNEDGSYKPPASPAVVRKEWGKFEGWRRRSDQQSRSEVSLSGGQL